MFGKNEEPEIPFHCVQRGGNWYQISLVDFVDPGSFARMPEAAEYALLESTELFDPRGMYGEALVGIRRLAGAGSDYAAIRCVYYLNGRYCPSEDRRLYYSLDLDNPPPDYERSIAELRRQEIGSKEDCERREGLFRRIILKFIEERA